MITLIHQRKAPANCWFHSVYLVAKHISIARFFSCCQKLLSLKVFVEMQYQISPVFVFNKKKKKIFALSIFVGNKDSIQIIVESLAGTDWLFLQFSVSLSNFWLYVMRIFLIARIFCRLGCFILVFIHGWWILLDVLWMEHGYLVRLVNGIANESTFGVLVLPSWTCCEIECCK